MYSVVEIFVINKYENKMHYNISVLNLIMVVEIIMKSGYIIVTLQHIIKRFVLCMCVFVYVGCCDVCGSQLQSHLYDFSDVNDKLKTFINELYKLHTGNTNNNPNKILIVAIEKNKQSDSEVQDEEKIDDIFDGIRRICCYSKDKQLAVNGDCKQYLENHSDIFKIIITNEYMFQNKGIPLEYGADTGDGNDMDKGYKYEQNRMKQSGAIPKDSDQDTSSTKHSVDDVSTQNDLQKNCDEAKETDISDSDKQKAAFMLGRLKAISEGRNVIIVPNFLFKVKNDISDITNVSDDVVENIAKMLAYSGYNTFTDYITEKPDTEIHEDNDVMDNFVDKLTSQFSIQVSDVEEVAECHETVVKDMLQDTVQEILSIESTYSKDIDLLIDKINGKLKNVQTTDEMLFKFGTKDVRLMINNCIQDICQHKHYTELINKSFYIYNNDIVSYYLKHTYAEEYKAKSDTKCKIDSYVYVFGDGHIKTNTLTQKVQDNSMREIIMDYFIHKTCLDVKFLKNNIYQDTQKLIIQIVQSNYINILNSFTVDNINKYIMYNIINIQVDPTQHNYIVHKIQDTKESFFSALQQSHIKKKSTCCAKASSIQQTDQDPCDTFILNKHNILKIIKTTKVIKFVDKNDENCYYYIRFVEL